MDRIDLGLLVFVSVETVMVLVILAGIVEIRFADGGMTIGTLLIFFLGVLGSSYRKRHEQKAHDSGYD
jgi:hypothetical protein